MNQPLPAIHATAMPLQPLGVNLLSLAKAVPPYRLDTPAVAAKARELFLPIFPEFDRLLPVFENTGIKTRYSVRPYSWFEQPQDWPARSSAYLEGATALLRDVAAQALDDADCRAADIDMIVTVSSTGIATPSLETHLLREFGFRADVRRVPVFGLGCAGGVSGAALAARLAAAEPGCRVLLLVVELCTLAFRGDELSKSNIVATALFGDGAAAAVLSTAGDSRYGVIEWAGEHTFPDSLDIMGWRVDPQGFGAIFSRSIPDFVTAEMSNAAAGFLARHGLSLADIDQFVCHPGGAKVIDALETAYNLQTGSLMNEREILADYGNMSAPTALFVLERALKVPFSGRRMISALGPGFTASFFTMQA